MSEERAKELLWMNRILAILVVLLALAAGYLLAEKNLWIKTL